MNRSFSLLAALALVACADAPTPEPTVAPPSLAVQSDRGRQIANGLRDKFAELDAAGLDTLAIVAIVEQVPLANQQEAVDAVRRGAVFTTDDPNASPALLALLARQYKKDKDR